MTTSPHWTEGLLPEALRRRMCELLRHEQGDGLTMCPITDAAAVEQLLDRLETLEHELAELTHHNAATEGAARARHDDRHP